MFAMVGGMFLIVALPFLIASRVKKYYEKKNELHWKQLDRIFDKTVFISYGVMVLIFILVGPFFIGL